MEKKLPSVFVNSKASNINGNNKKVYYSFYNRNQIIDKKYSDIDIRRKINDLLLKSDFNYKVKVNIAYSNGESKEETIVFRNYDYLLTIEGKRIKIDDIVDIN